MQVVEYVLQYVNSGWEVEKINYSTVLLVYVKWEEMEKKIQDI